MQLPLLSAAYSQQSRVQNSSRSEPHLDAYLSEGTTRSTVRNFIQWRSLRAVELQCTLASRYNDIAR